MSLYDIKHQFKQIKVMLHELMPDDQFKKKFSVGITQVNGMTYKAVALDKLQGEEDGSRLKVMTEVLTASGAVPAYFQPMKYQDKYVYDGGLIHEIDIETAISRCLEQVSAESDIVLDVISVNDKGREALLSPFVKKVNRNDWPELSKALKKHPDVNFRHLIMPKEKILKNFDNFNFDHENTDKILKQGIKDA